MFPRDASHDLPHHVIELICSQYFSTSPWPRHPPLQVASTTMSTGAHHLLSADPPESALKGSHPNGDPTLHGASGFKLGNFCVDEYRPIRVAVIGAGFSGVTAAIRFRQKVPNVTVNVYEKNRGVGGTWFANRYPGLACDIPSHCYQLTFEAKTDWSAVYAPGPEIREYIEGVVEKWKLQPLIHLSHELVGARWEEAAGKWHLTIRHPKSDDAEAADGETTFEEFEDVVDVLFTGVGSLSRWSWPDIPGLQDFKGRLLHSANWDLTPDPRGRWEEGIKDWGDKRVGVIGVGASAIQIVPALQPNVAKIVNYVRGKTWFSAPFAEGKLAELIGKTPTGENYYFTNEDKARFSDPRYYEYFRHELESDLNVRRCLQPTECTLISAQAVHQATVKGSKLQELGREAFAAVMKQRLAKKPWIAEKLIPNFAVACRRLTPGPGYLEALCEDNVDFVTSEIKRVTPTGIETADGQHQELDVIICATGFDASFNLGFSCVGRNGIDLADRFAPHPETYLTVCTDGFPNWFMSLGPNSAVGSGSLLVLIERQIDYAVMATCKLQRERLKSIEAKPEAVRDFDDYLEHYFPTSVYSEKCRSWYKMGKEEGRVTGLWPGSCLHAVRALAHPRWEDFNYQHLSGEPQNRFYWLGDGQTYNEKTFTGDRAWYLNPEEIDKPPMGNPKLHRAHQEVAWNACYRILYPVVLAINVAEFEYVFNEGQGKVAVHALTDRDGEPIHKCLVDERLYDYVPK
ncbi:FAD/NAD(P)-binding domain-containing protein [Punctularia strigosozonata HHB-11173 SS5]|uniref:FAD/NAD(P)-binding domain-containing protein n=1 Tax=Punctularia strigosozonata (strain HHB-11173) TaxID=741275 RepID=UPI0004417A46|nr:FAD/NAD(P)-binding domain-containing protein [Punctularia strigosozonata HHB-11173 SS5]EIN14235.1 FAD/NAD(P)-binding domain-containing protein [Punctularia strigosozonata HHB-11173 SS5]